MANWLPQNTFVIAELSANHNQDLTRAKRTIEAMARSGADAVKVQTYKPESLCLNIDNDYFGRRKQGLWQGQTLWEIYQQGTLPYDWHLELKQHANELGLLFFSSPFDLEAVDFLESIDLPFYKIASFEITHLPLIEKIASTGKPIIISTGVAELDDICLALETCYQQENYNIALLKCTSAYPASLEDANLATMVNMNSQFCLPVGVSDHTLDSLVPIVAVSLGGKIVEKHFTLSRSDGGPDAAFSLEPDEFKKMVQQIRQAEACLGEVDYQVTKQDKLRRRSIFYTSDKQAGEVILATDIRVLRGGAGLHPEYYQQLVGEKLNVAVKLGEPVLSSHFDAHKIKKED